MPIFRFSGCSCVILTSTQRHDFNFLLFLTWRFFDLTCIIIRFPIRSTEGIEVGLRTVYVAHTPDILSIFITLCPKLANVTGGCLLLTGLARAFMDSISRSRSCICSTGSFWDHKYLTLLFAGSLPQVALILVALSIGATHRHVVTVTLELTDASHSVSNP